ncbi:Protein of unknown function [Gryllus bimaculatus]|nr:Protein of unknown function [Gryllus bimaculatus]
MTHKAPTTYSNRTLHTLSLSFLYNLLQIL